MSKESDEHIHRYDLGLDSIEDEGELPRWACVKCGQEAIIGETAGSPWVYYFAGMLSIIVGIIAGVILVKA
jgi:hypothetical protein